MKTLITMDRILGAGRSLTVWFNGMMALLISFYEIFKDEVPKLQELLPPDAYHDLAIVMIVVNTLLRFKTTKDLANK
jgi:Na+-translocating ferredoxin:NAD+ oxidoreductase RnfE subunit